jgi:hypothetical protein
MPARSNNICVGELIALLTLTNVLNYFKVHKVDTLKVCVTGLPTYICVDD